MLDELFDLVAGALPLRVFLALLAFVIVCIALVVLWAVYG